MTSLGNWAPSPDTASFGSLAVTQTLHLALTIICLHPLFNWRNKRGSHNQQLPYASGYGIMLHQPKLSTEETKDLLFPIS